jgi:hypothetical protein
VELGNSCGNAAVPDVTSPLGVTATMSDPTFTTGDHPMETIEVEFVYLLEEGSAVMKRTAAGTLRG